MASCLALFGALGPAALALGLARPEPTPRVQDYSTYKGFVKAFENEGIAEKIETGIPDGWRPWTFRQLARFKALPSAPRPAVLMPSEGDDPDAEIDRLWAKVIATQPGKGEAETALPNEAMSGFFEALTVFPEGALEHLPTFTSMPGVDRRAQLWILAKASNAAWALGERGHCEELLNRYDDLLGADAPPSEVYLLEARYLVHALRGLGAIRDGRPDLAYEPLRIAQSTADDYRLAGGDVDVWGDSIIKRLDLAHASDDVSGGREIGRQAFNHAAWAPLEGRAPELAIRWRLDALDLIDPESTKDDVQSALDSVAETVLEDSHATALWKADRQVGGRHHIRASIRHGEYERARRLLGLLESEGVLARSEAEVLSARIRCAQEGPSEDLTTLLSAAVRDRIALWRDSPESQRSRGLLHFDDDAELVSLALQGLARTRGGAEAALELLGEVQTAGTLAGALGAEAPSAQAVMDLAPVNGGCLVFAPGFETDHLFLIDGQSIDLVEVEDATKLQLDRKALARAFRLALSEDSAHARNEFEELSAKLAARLFTQKVRDRLGDWESVWIIGTDAWGDAPFELLPIDGSRWGATKEIAYAPSLPIAAALVKRRLESKDPPPGDVLVAIATDAGDLARLSYPSAVHLGDGEAVGRSLIPPELASTTTMLLDGNATLDAWTSALEASPWLSVVVGHGVRNRDGSRGVLFYGGSPEGGVLTPRAAISLRTPEVIVLASCEAGRRAYLRGGDGADGLAGALLTSGASVVVGAEVPLELRTAVSQSRAVLEDVAIEGQSVARALLEGRRAAPNDLARWVVRATGDGHRRGWVSPPKIAADFKSSTPSNGDGGTAWIVAGLLTAVLAAALVTARRRVAST